MPVHIREVLWEMLMLSFIGLMAVLVVCFVLLCISGFERSMGLCVDYWNKRQYFIWKLVSGIIGSCFLLAIGLVCLFSPENFSDKTIIFLVIAAFIAVGIFSSIVHFIAWRRKQDLLKEKVKEFLEQEFEGAQANHISEAKERCVRKISNEHIFNNGYYYSRKQIEKAVTVFLNKAPGKRQRRENGRRQGDEGRNGPGRRGDRGGREAPG